MRCVDLVGWQVCSHALFITLVDRLDCRSSQEIFLVGALAIRLICQGEILPFVDLCGVNRGHPMLVGEWIFQVSDRLIEVFALLAV